MIWDLAGDRRLGRPFDFDAGLLAQVAATRRWHVLSHALTPDGRTLAVGHGDGTVTLLDARTLRERSSFRAVPNGPGSRMAYLPGGQLLAIGGDDGFLALFDPERGELRPRRCPATRPSAAAPSFSADGRLMATARRRRFVLLWTLRSGRPVGAPRELLDPRWASWTPTLSPDGRTLAIASDAGRRVPRCRHVAAAARRSRDATVRRGIASRPTGASSSIGRLEGLRGLSSTDTWRPVSPPARRAYRRRHVLGVRQPGWTHARHRELGRHDPPVRHRHRATARGAAARPCPTSRRAAVLAGRRVPVRHHGHRTRLSLGRAAVRRGSGHACAVAGRSLTRSGVDRSAARPRLRARVLTSLQSQVGRVSAFTKSSSWRVVQHS